MPVLRRLDINILDDEGLLLLQSDHLLLHPLLVHERVGGVQGAQVLRPAGLDAGDARVGGEGLLLEPLHHEGGRGPNLGVDVRLLIIYGADLVSPVPIVLVISEVLHRTQEVSGKLLSLLDNRNKILCRKPYKILTITSRTYWIGSSDLVRCSELLLDILVLFDLLPLIGVLYLLTNQK